MSVFDTLVPRKTPSVVGRSRLGPSDCASGDESRLVIPAGLHDLNQSIEFRRIVITEKEQGYGKAAVALVKELAFETYKAHRLWLDVKEQNHHARAVYEATGFTVEGTLRECLRAENGYDSLVIMSALQHEYEMQGNVDKNAGLS